MYWKNVLKTLKMRKVTIWQLSKMTGIHYNTLYSYKKGHEPTFGNMVKIADALGVSLDDFR